VPKPPTIADLRWSHDLVFEATSGMTSMLVDGDSREGPSPVQSLVIALASCMAADVASILAKGRHPYRSLRAHVVADRAQDHPHRVLRVNLRFAIEGAVPGDAVARAIALSHDKYCSVWHSMAKDIEFTTAYDIEG
jgi:putative redox protein